MTERTVKLPSDFAKKISESLGMTPLGVDTLIRNIARAKDGRLYHWGCLQSALYERFQCQECWTSFDGTQAGFSEAQSLRNDSFRERSRPACPNCGSINLKRGFS